ncbi:MAG: T9SS type A sorting domain-containing protein [Candidatus Latescibacter sp.]|nr:T9SS type A sorting domain-containing protein [Candidatus Latescibacter sp.]
MTVSMGYCRFGNLPENETWSESQGNYYIGDDFTIPSGRTLTLPGASSTYCTLYVSPGKSILVNGTLTTNWSRFKTDTENYYWNGITINSGATLNVNGGSIIDYATIGLNVCSDSLYFPTTKSTISNCRDWGMLISNCAPTIKNIDFQDNGTTDYHGGVCIQGSGYRPYLKKITIHDSRYGLYLTSSADATLEYSTINFTDPSSGLDRIFLYDFAGLDIDGRRNNIYDNTNASYWAIKFSAGGPNIAATRNYWGTGSPIRGVLFNDSTRVTDISGYATANIDSAGAPKVVAEIASYPFIKADAYESVGDWKSALSVYQDIMAKSADPGEKRLALKSLLKLCGMKQYDYSVFRTLIANERKTAQSWYASSLDYLSCESLVSEGKYTEAIAAFSEKATQYSGNVMEVEMLSRIASIYGQNLHDKGKAKVYADMAAAINPGQPILLSAYSSAGIEYDPWKHADKYLANSGQPGEDKPLPGDNGQAEKIKEYVTVSPNPANPLTTITYSLASSTKVKLDIYAVNGQKVATLVDGTASAGVHAVKFDGSRYGSGLYFYRLASDRFTKTGKMMLLK